jgi:hypothetical protein
MLKSFLIGAVVGAVLAVAPAYNYGRGAPVLSNPFAARGVGTIVGTIVGETARNVAGDVKKGIRELSK